MKEINAYRIVEIDGNKIKPLFHGVRGKRVFPYNEWIKADKKLVSDGSHKTKKNYLSGFHFLLSKEETERFLGTRFKNKEKRIVVPCRVRKNIRKKYSGTCYLADEIYFDDQDALRELRGYL